MASRLALVALVLVGIVAYGEAQRSTRQQQPPVTQPSTTVDPSTLVDQAGAPVNCPCQTTAEHNPVCGSNGATYNNPGKLRCAQRCGHDVSLVYYGQCVRAARS